MHARNSKNNESKHPPASVPTFQQLQFTRKQVGKVATSFKKGTAPDPDGIRAVLIKAAIKLFTTGRQGTAEEALTILLSMMTAGHVPDYVAHFLCGARLHARLKTSGGICTIAVGNIPYPGG